MNHISNDIIIIGTNHHNTLSMVRSFGEEGVNVTLFIYGDEKSFIAYSRYVNNVSYYSTAIEAVEAIKMYTSRCKPLVIACSDEVSSVMDNRYDDFIDLCYFFNAGGKGIITEYMDKQKQLDLAKNCGFKVPFSLCSIPSKIDVNRVNYPCFVKPKESIHGGKHISICYFSKELISSLCEYPPTYDVLVQDYIQKDYEIVILGFSSGNEFLIPGYIHKHREEKGGTTFSTVYPISHLDSCVVDSCKKLIKAIGYNGMWGIECIKQGNNHYFIELNMRNDATTYAMKVAGVNLPYYYYLKQKNPNFKIENMNVRFINAMVEFNDFNFVLKRKVSLFKWLNNLKSSECRYYYSQDDPKPFKIKKNEYLRFLIKRIFHV